MVIFSLVSLDESTWENLFDFCLLVLAGLGLILSKRVPHLDPLKIILTPLEAISPSFSTMSGYWPDQIASKDSQIFKKIASGDPFILTLRTAVLNIHPLQLRPASYTYLSCGPGREK